MTCALPVCPTLNQTLNELGVSLVLLGLSPIRHPTCVSPVLLEQNLILLYRQLDCAYLALREKFLLEERFARRVPLDKIRTMILTNVFRVQQIGYPSMDPLVLSAKLTPSQTLQEPNAFLVHLDLSLCLVSLVYLARREARPPLQQMVLALPVLMMSSHLVE